MPFVSVFNRFLALATALMVILGGNFAPARADVAASDAQLGAVVEGADLRRSIDALFDPLDKPDGPGAVVLLTQNGETRYERTYGLADLEHGVPITPQTVFHVASVSKQFTAYAVHLLAAEGKIDLDADYRVYRPESPDRGAPITVRQLLNHTSGLASTYASADLAGARDDGVTPLIETFRHAEAIAGLNHAPGAEYSYTNVAYTYLAQIVGRVSGVGFKPYLQRAIFEPVGLTVSRIHDDASRVVANRAQSYGFKDGAWRRSYHLNGVIGGTNLNTTARELARWMDHLMALQDTNPALWRALTTVADQPEGLDYADGGLFRRDLDGVVTFSHGGANADYRALVAFAPDHKLSAVVLTNTTEGQAHRKAQGMLALALGKTGPTDETPPFEGAIDADAVRPALGSYAMERAAVADKARANMPALTTVGLRLTAQDTLEIRRDGGSWAPATLASPTSLRIDDVLIDLSGAQAVVTRQTEGADDMRSVQTIRPGCSTAYKQAVSGIYVHEAMRAEVHIAVEDGAFVGRNGPGRRTDPLICYADSLIERDVDDLNDEPGYTLLAARPDGESTQTVYLWSRLRARRVPFERVGPAN